MLNTITMSTKMSPHTYNLLWQINYNNKQKITLKKHFQLFFYFLCTFVEDEDADITITTFLHVYNACDIITIILIIRKKRTHKEIVLCQVCTDILLPCITQHTSYQSIHHQKICAKDNYRLLRCPIYSTIQNFHIKVPRNYTT